MFLIISIIKLVNTSPIIAVFALRIFDNANVISSSLGVVLPGSITDGRTDIGGTGISLRIIYSGLISG